MKCVIYDTDRSVLKHIVGGLLYTLFTILSIPFIGIVIGLCHLAIDTGIFIFIGIILMMIVGTIICVVIILVIVLLIGLLHDWAFKSNKKDNYVY